MIAFAFQIFSDKQDSNVNKPTPNSEFELEILIL